jgi:alkylation response protein AidB-like acyl-CoA dehydrogenase
MALLRADGGLEVSPLAALAVYEELAAAEASVAWVAWNNSLVCWFARHLEPAARREIFGDAGAVFANSTRPSGRAVADGDGFRVNGRWSLVSGCMHASWIPVMCLMEENGEVRMLGPGVPDMRMFFVPRERYEILDTWHVGGLRGTGSHDAILADEHVPAERAFSPFMGERFVDSPFGQVPITVTMAAGCAAICIGVARAALEALVELGRARVTPGPEPDLRDRPRTQATVARVAAALEALRRNLHSRYGLVWRAVEAGNEPALESIADAWAAAIAAALECRSMLTDIYAIAGTAALYVDNPIERAHRDIHAVLQHMVVQPSWLEDAGRVKLGLAPASPIFAV